MDTHKRRRARIPVAVALCLASPPLAGQQRLAVDHEAGREVVNDWTRAFLTHVFEVDHARRLIYAAEVGEPAFVVAFSIADGALVGTYGRGRGEGPGEVPFMVQDVAAADGGLLVSDGRRIHYWSLFGDSTWTWTPDLNFAVSVCAMGDNPVVPLLDGALRGPGGARLGAGRLPLAQAGRSRSLRGTDGVCLDSVAYFFVEDAIAGHTTGGESIAVPVPREITEGVRDWRASRPDGGRHSSSYATLSQDGRGRLVLTLLSHMRLGFTAAVIDPATGCYSLLLDERSNVHRSIMGVHRDSAIVYERGVSVREINGRRARVIDAEAFMIALRPLRPAGGAPCMQ
ncbi:hypothetical protein [Candidatus Palauibacter sp.]|uniref:hypothetical protein n=1 Tax=Candidatus Palauibacter sp. TaxID=3101350 RepID=UPI003B02192A